MKNRIGLSAMFLFFAIIFSCAFTTLAFAAGGNGWIATDTYRVMNFVVLAVGLGFILKKPVSEVLSSRIAGIKEQLSDLEKKKKDARKELAEYEKKFSNLDKEASEIAALYRKQGIEAKERILAETKTVAAKMEKAAKKNIEHEFKETKKRLQQDVIAKSLTKARELIKSKINADDHKRLIDEYLIKVVA